MAMVSRESQTDGDGQYEKADVGTRDAPGKGPDEVVDVSFNSNRGNREVSPTRWESGSDLGEEDIFDPGHEILEAGIASETVSLETRFEPVCPKSCLKTRNADGGGRCIGQGV